MKEKWQKHKIKLILFLIIIVQLAYITYAFAVQKEGYHYDEGMSYQFANANYERWIYMTDDAWNWKNNNQWIDSQKIHEFITVQDGMQFHYDAVSYNMWKDMNPPLHSYLLHTICSFFPDTFSWWYAYIINVIAFFATMIAFYFLVKELTYSRKLALIACAGYGFTTGALFTFIFLRGYALITTFSILLFWIHCRMYRRRFQKIYGYLAGIFVIMILGGLTHYTFLLLGLCLTVVFGLYLLLKKRWLTMFLYGEVMALSVLALLFLWPPLLDVLAVGNSNLDMVQLPFGLEIRFSVLYWTREAIGIPVRFPSVLFWAYVGIVLLFVILSAAAAAFICRNEEKYQKWIKQTRESVRRYIRKIPGRLRRMNKLYIMCFAVMTGTVIGVTYMCDMFTMNKWSDRYLFYIMPGLLAVFLGVVCLVVKKCTRKKKKWRNALIAIVLAAAVISSHVVTPHPYAAFFGRECDDVTIEEMTKGADVIAVMRAIVTMPYYTMMARDSEHFFAVSGKECMEQEVLEQLEKLPEGDRPVYLIVQKEIFLPEESDRDQTTMTVQEKLSVDYKLSEVLQKYSQLSWADGVEEIHTEKSFQGPLCIYRLR